MNAREAGHTCWISESFDVTLKLLRSALADARLSILGELDVSGSHSASFHGKSRILYVDAPLLMFEALALDRAPAVFMPLHVLIAGDDMRARVCWADPAAVLGARLPAGAAAPMRELQERVSHAVDACTQLQTRPDAPWARRQGVRRRALAWKRGAAHYV